jgi:integrase/recombinase XerD
MEAEHVRTNGETVITSLTFEQMLRYLEHLHSMELRANTKAIYVTALKSLYRWLDLQKKAPFDPQLIPSISIDPSVSSRNASTREEVEAILGTFDEYFPEELRNKACISLLWDSGMRLSEMLSLNVGDIDTETMHGRVKTYKRKNHIRTIRWWYSTNELLKQWCLVRSAVLEREGSSQNALFITLAPNCDYIRLGRHVPQGAIRNARKKVGITRQITPHALRHGNLTDMLKAGMNIREVQEHAGHAKVTTTQIYTHVEEGEIDRAYRRIQSERYTHPAYASKTHQKETYGGLRRRREEGRPGYGLQTSEVALPDSRQENEPQPRQRAWSREGSRGHWG